MEDCSRYTKKMYLGLLLFFLFKFILDIIDYICNMWFIVLLGGFILLIYILKLVLPWFKCMQDNKTLRR